VSKTYLRPKFADIRGVENGYENRLEHHEKPDKHDTSSIIHGPPLSTQQPGQGALQGGASDCVCNRDTTTLPKVRGEPLLSFDRVISQCDLAGS